MELQKLLVFAVVIVSVVFITGVGGYIIIEGWSLFDAVYMTVITIAGVGYREVHPLSVGGRIFTTFLIAGGVGSMVFTLTVAVAFIVEGTLKNIIRDRKMQKIVDKLENHYIICGIGATGRTVVEEFLRVRVDFAVIVPPQQEIDRLIKMYPDLVYVQGDATDDDVLIKAGIKRAKGLISTLPEDKDNLFVVLSARELNPRLRIVAKTIEEESRYKILKVGADSVVSPNNIGGLRMASEMIRPDVVSFLDSMMRDKEMTLRVEEATIQKGSGFEGKTIQQADIGKKTGVIIIAVKDSDSQKYIYNPRADTSLKADDILLMIGNLEQVAKLRQLAEKTGLVMGDEKPPPNEAAS